MQAEVQRIRPVLHRAGKDVLAFSIRLVLRRPWHCFFASLTVSFLFWLAILVRPAPKQQAQPEPTSVSTRDDDPLLRPIPQATNTSLTRKLQALKEPVVDNVRETNMAPASAPTPALATKAGGEAPSLSSALWVWPADERAVTSGFGGRLDPMSEAGYQEHHGLDIRSPCGTPVLAAGEGEVVLAEWTPANGNIVKIQHPGGLTSRYAHLARLDVLVGQHVTAGQQIGFSGASGRSTGPHLHFEIRKGNRALNPLGFKYRYEPSWVFARRDLSVDCGAGRSAEQADLIDRGTRIDGSASAEADDLLHDFGDYVRSY